MAFLASSSALSCAMNSAFDMAISSPAHARDAFLDHELLVPARVPLDLHLEGMAGGGGGPAPDVAHGGEPAGHGALAGEVLGGHPLHRVLGGEVLVEVIDTAPLRGRLGLAHG